MIATKCRDELTFRTLETRMIELTREIGLEGLLEFLSLESEAETESESEAEAETETA